MIEGRGEPRGKVRVPGLCGAGLEIRFPTEKLREWPVVLRECGLHGHGGALEDDRQGGSKPGILRATGVMALCGRSGTRPLGENGIFH